MKKIISSILMTLLFVATVLMTNAQDSKKTPEKQDNLKTVSYSVNMHCESCKNTIGKMLAYEKGVKSFDINLDLKKVTVKYDPAKTDADKLGKAIEKLGYKVTPYTSSGTNCPQAPGCQKSKSGCQDH